MKNTLDKELEEDFFKTAKPFKELFPKVVEAQLNKKIESKPMGRPKIDNPKKLTSLRLDAEVIEFFKRDGKGWQTRLNKVLKEFVLSHS